jgi:hypothetical protein
MRLAELRLCLDNLKLTERNGMERNGTERNGMERNKDSIPLFGYFTTEWNSSSIPLFVKWTERNEL